MIKVAVVGSRSFPARYGGIETVCENLYTGLARYDFRIIMFCRSRRISLDNKRKGITVFNFPAVPIPGLSTFLHSFVATILATASDAHIIHFHAQGPALFSFIPKIFSPRKIIIFTCQGIDWKRDKWNWFARKVIKAGERNSVRFTDVRIVVSKEIKKYYRDVYGAESILLSNGIVAPRLQALNGLNKKFDIRKEKYLLFTGRLVPEKGLDILISAFNQIDTSIKLMIAGDFQETPRYGKQLLLLANENPNIIFTSRLKGAELSQLYSNALGYISASKLEGNPLSVLEAMSYGLPVILSSIPPHEEILALYEDLPALGFEVGSISGCRKAIVDFLSIAVKDYAALKRKSREITQEFFTIDQLVTKTRLIYSNLVYKDNLPQVKD